MGLFGGQKTTIPATGFYTQPKQYQDLYGTLLSRTNAVLDGQYGYGLDTYRPMDLTGAEQGALKQMEAGYAPTEQSLKKDVGLFMNPYEQNVTDAVNREATGQNSLVNQAAARSGQMGSNRSFLQNSDVEQNRLNAIGQLRAGQYNSAVNNVLNGLIPQRQADAASALHAGEYQRNLNLQQKQAPMELMRQSYGLFNSIPQEFGNFGTPEKTVKTGGGIGGMLGTLAPIVGNMIAPGIGGAIGGALGGLASGGGIGGALQGAIGGYGGMGSIGSSLGLTGGYSPSSGITWNSGRMGGGGFF